MLKLIQKKNKVTAKLKENAKTNKDKRNNFKIYAETNKNAQIILNNYDKIPETLTKLAANRKEAIDFVAKYIDDKITNNLDYSNIKNSDKFPFYLQWDKRWGYNKYGAGMIADYGCGPTAIAMILAGIKNEPNITPDIIAESAKKKGYDGEFGTKWIFFKHIANKYNVKTEKIVLNYNILKKNLIKEKVALVSVKKGNFTSENHLITIIGIEPDGKLIINDPNSIQNTTNRWNFKNIEAQIKGIWIFSK